MPVIHVEVIIEVIFSDPEIIGTGSAKTSANSTKQSLGEYGDDFTASSPHHHHSFHVPR